MKENKKKWYIVIGVVVAIVAAVILYFCIAYLPKLQVGKEISDLLQPLLTEENQSMHLDISADLAGELVDFESDIYLVKEDETKYIVMEQYDFPIYVVDNVLYLENGHAFKIAEEMQTQSVEYKDLFLQIAAAYEVFDITCVKTDLETGYSVNVTGEQVQELLRIVMPASAGAGDGVSKLLSSIENLNLQMSARNDKLDQIEMSGSADIDGKSVQVEIVISEFQVLDAGEYAIPDVVMETVKTVDKDALFNLTEDLYRLIVAFEQFSKQETPTGTVTLSANCGIIDFRQTYDLKELENLADTGNAGTAGTIGNGSVDAEAVENLPAMIGFLCMEGEISCTETDGVFVYQLALDQKMMGTIAEAVAPELVNYVLNLTKGIAEVTIEEEQVSTIKIQIDGSVRVLFTDVPMEVGAEFVFLNSL